MSYVEMWMVRGIYLPRTAPLPMECRGVKIVGGAVGLSHLFKAY